MSQFENLLAAYVRKLLVVGDHEMKDDLVPDMIVAGVAAMERQQ